MQYTDNREIEGRIFHLAKEFQVPLFEKDAVVEKRIESLYRVRFQILQWAPNCELIRFQNFKLFLRAKTDLDKGKKEPSPIETMSAQIKTHYNRVVEQLASIDEVWVFSRGTGSVSPSLP